MTALVTENMASLAGAPNGIRTLRELVLDLAMRGVLVEQVAGNESAVELLHDATSDGGRKKGKTSRKTSNVPDEFPFVLPASWTWVRLGAIAAKITDGTHHSPTNTATGDFKYISAKNIKTWGIDLSDVTYVTREDHEQIFARCDPAEGDVLYIKDGATTGVATINTLAEPFSMLSSVALIKPGRAIANTYLLMAMRAPFFYREMRAGMTGVAITRVTLGKLNDALLPLPPLAEQHRIVAKVDELMALCDRLEAQQQGAEAAHAQLVQALLDSLTQARDADDFRASWQRLSVHFQELFTTESSIDLLTDAILALAVSGRLAAQDSSDEPATSLLHQLAIDASEFSARQKAPRAQVETVNESDVPFKAPSGWAWARLGSIFRVITDGDHQAPPQTANGVAFLTIGNVTDGYLNFDQCRSVDSAYFAGLAGYRKPAAGDLLYTVVGATYGRPVLVETDRPFCVQRHIAILKRSEQLNGKFALYLLESPLIYSQASASTTGTAQPTIPLKPLRNFLVPLPPLAEQHRIVAKVDELLALCGQLKARIAAARQQHGQLAGVLVAQAVEA